jgi:signal transduction histidine kinase
MLLTGFAPSESPNRHREAPVIIRKLFNIDLNEDYRPVATAVGAISASRVNIVMLVVASVMTVLPITLNLSGLDFGMQGAAGGIDPAANRTAAMLHAMLEWAAFMLAVFVAIMAFIQHRINGDPIVPIIGFALLCSGTLDMFNVVVQERLLASRADSAACTSFFWLLGRCFNAVIPLAGALLLVGRSDRDLRQKAHRLLVRFSVFFGLLLLGLVVYGLLAETLHGAKPPMSDRFLNVFARPLDLLPVVFYLIAGLLVYPIWHQRRGDHFMMTMGVAMLPSIAVQLHMAIGSTMIFDNDYFVAHYLKVLAYSMPVVGLCLDYVRTYRAEIEASREMRTMGQILDDEQMRLNMILHKMGQGVVVTDRFFRVQIVNREAESYLGVSEFKARGRNLLELVDDEGFTETWRSTVAQDIDFHRVRLDIQYPETRHLWVTRSSYHPPSGRRGYIVILHDMTREQELDKLKANFISAVSHELRTPLTSIRGFISTIRREPEMPVEQKDRFLGIVETESGRLNDLVEDLLSIGQLEDGSVHLDMRLFHVTDLVNQLRDSMMAAAEAKGHDLCFNVPGDLPMLLGDHSKISSALNNLITNAVKYTPSGGRIEVAIDADRQTVNIRVRDNGIGIEEEDKPRIFDRFYRSPKVVNKAQGSGLGLAIVRELVDLHGGRIDVESTLNEGSEFTLRLPVPNQADIATLDISAGRAGYERTTIGPGR